MQADPANAYEIVVIADDLTGAADSGVCFTRAGLSASIALSEKVLPPAGALVFTSESRNLSEAEARASTRSFIPAAKRAGIVYKKIDSTLRGFPGPELAEIIAGLGAEKVLVAPAFPAQGRTTVGGRQRIQGLPLEQTPFRGQTATSDLSVLLRACGLPVRPLSLEQVRSGPARIQAEFARPGPLLLVGDAETEADLHSLADAALLSGLRLFCGSAGLAAALADRLERPGALHPALTSQPAFPGKKGPVLVIAGSRNPVTAAQLETARDAGVCLLEPEPDFEPGDSPPQALIRAAGQPLAMGQDVILSVSNSRDSSLGSRAVAEGLARWAAFFVARQELGGLVLTGGDIAMAVLSALHSEGLSLWGELQPGIPLAILAGGIRPGLPIITKAGGFGGPEDILKAVQFLRTAGAA